jgi:hypothetical protein
LGHEFQRHPRHHAVDRVADRRHQNRAGIDAGDIEMGIDQILDRDDGRAHGTQDILAGFIGQSAFQRADEQRQGRQRLAQIMVGDREEPVLGAGDALGLVAGILQRRFQVPDRGDILRDGQHDPAPAKIEGCTCYRQINRIAIAIAMLPQAGLNRIDVADPQFPKPFPVDAEQSRCGVVDRQKAEIVGGVQPHRHRIIGENRGSGDDGDLAFARLPCCGFAQPDRAAIGKGLTAQA